MSKKILLILFIILWAMPAWPEMITDTAWVRKYNGPGDYDDIIEAMAVDDSGNVYVTGESWGSNEYDYCTIKYAPDGTILWIRRYDGPVSLDDQAYAIAIDDEGNVLVTGRSVGNDTTWDYATIKYYPNGDTVWIRRYNGPVGDDDIATEVAVDDHLNVYVTGSSVGRGTDILTGYDYATIKYDPNGKQLWVQRYDGPKKGLDCPRALAVDGLGYAYVTGISCDSFFTNCEYATIKYYANGKTAWVRRYDGFEAHAISIDDNYNAYVTGSDGVGDYATVKYGPSGNQLWVQTYNGPGNCEDVAVALAIDSHNNICVTGYTRNSWGNPYNSDYATVKYDSSGNQIWVRTYNGVLNLDDEPRAMAMDQSGNVYVTGVTGFSWGHGTSDDCATIKYNPEGNEVWLFTYNGNERLSDEANAIAVDDFGNVFVAGYSFSSETNKDYLTIKYYQVLRGDANKDGVIDINDVVYLISYLYMNGYAPEPVEAGNTNCDRVVDVGDIIFLINYVLKGGPEPSCL